MFLDLIFHSLPQLKKFSFYVDLKRNSRRQKIPLCFTAYLQIKISVSATRYHLHWRYHQWYYHVTINTGCYQICGFYVVFLIMLCKISFNKQRRINLKT